MLAMTMPLFIVLAVLALRGQRWAYAVFIVAGLTFFAARVGFRPQPQPCELLVPLEWLLLSFTNYRHIILFAMFYLLSHAQVRTRGARGHRFAAAATLGMGALLEIAQAMSGSGHCRLRDLLPDAVGAALGFSAIVLWQRLQPRITGR